MNALACVLICISPALAAGRYKRGHLRPKHPFEVARGIPSPLSLRHTHAFETMKNNQPISQREFDIPDGVTLMSTTDPQGHILYANAAFVHVSGFGADELIGQPHNIVRHPDMPPAAYADMWRTLATGQSWTGLVKNRRKNGDHYWVRANAAPVNRRGQLVGYISVRTKPTRQEVEQASALYEAVNAGQAAGLRIHKGLVVRTGLGAWRSLPQTLSVAARIRLGVWGFAAMVGELGVWAGMDMASLGAFAVGTTLLALMADLWLQRQLAAPLRVVARQAADVAAGQFDANVRLNRVDDIGMILRGINQAGLNVRALVDDVGLQTEGVKTASGEIADASNDLGTRTEQSASSLEQTASSMQQMTASVAHSADTAAEAEGLASQAAQAAHNGGEVVSQLVQTMDQIHRSSQKISDIIGVIDSIAFQTNILALNAAVEAARAGEQGRGFAVVASEVRTLAQRSAAAAREIKALIGDSVDKVSAGNRQVTDSRHAMDDIVGQVKHVAELLHDINLATHRQSSGIAEVNAAIVELDRMTQQNAAMVEETAAAAGNLREQASHLVEAVAVFK